MSAALDTSALNARLRPLCPGIAEDQIQDFLSRVGSAYLEREPLLSIALHLRMASELTLDRLARIAVTPCDEGRYEVAIVAFDYFAEFALLCGLLAAHGLDILSGHIHTYEAATGTPPRRRGPRRAVPNSRRKIVDVFRVRPRGNVVPDAAVLESELASLLSLVADGRMAEARERVDCRIVESLERWPRYSSDAVAPVSIEFDDQMSERFTALLVRGPDTPAFLYALANALALRGVYVHSVSIESVGGEVRDAFLVSRRDGRRIESEDERGRLRLAVAVIKQFTQFLPWAPDPGLALKGFDQLIDRLLAYGPEAIALFSSPAGLQELARLLGSSAFLWEDFLRAQFDHLGPVLGAWREKPVLSRPALQEELLGRLAAASDDAARKAALNAFKDEQMLLVDMKYLLDPRFDIIAFQSALSDLAEAVLEEAVRLARERLIREHGVPRLEGGGECPVAVFGLGKFGGRELGFASDLELLVVYGGPGRSERSRLENGEFFEMLTRELLDLVVARAEGIFHLDLRLRPHGKKGPLATPLGAAQEYYRPGGEAAPFERQALIKLRFVCGDAALETAVLALRDAFCWSDVPWDRADALHLRERQARELVPPGRASVKHSRGGLVDVEYAVQYLQLQHGRARPELRTPSTLEALARLESGGLLPAGDAELLRSGYVFWRRVSDGLRMVRGQAGDLLLPEDASEEWRLLARRLGYSGADWASIAAALEDDVARHRRAVIDLWGRYFDVAR